MNAQRIAGVAIVGIFLSGVCVGAAGSRGVFILTLVLFVWLGFYVGRTR